MNEICLRRAIKCVHMSLSPERTLSYRQFHLMFSLRHREQLTIDSSHLSHLKLLPSVPLLTHHLLLFIFQCLTACLHVSMLCCWVNNEFHSFIHWFIYNKWHWVENIVYEYYWVITVSCWRRFNDECKLQRLFIIHSLHDRKSILDSMKFSLWVTKWL